MQEFEFTARDRQKIAKGIRKKYLKVADSPEGLFRFPTGRKGLEALRYPREIITSLPEVVQSSFCGVGNPFSLSTPRPGDSVLDVGCGAGVDTMVAAIMVGPEGSAQGIDFSKAMVSRANKNLAAAGLKNLSFQTASAEELPFTDETFEVVISNGAYNLVPDKDKALAEAYRVLKPGGRLLVADQVLDAPLAMSKKEVVACWFR